MLVSLFATGCQSLSFYSQAVQGQYQIWSRQHSIKKLLADAKTPEGLKRQLELVLRLRDFASAELALPANGHYLKYADLDRPFAVWNVHAAPEFSVEAKSWWYLVVGRLEYRGYFKEASARHYAEKLAKQGYDIFVGGVQAYSTLGWFRDPVLNTFVFEKEPDLAELLFHELAHQRVFAAGDTDFNEAFATAVAEEGVRRWLQAGSDTAAYQAFLARRRQEEQFVQMVLRARAQLAELFQGCTPDCSSRCACSMRDACLQPELRLKKRQIFKKLQEDYEALVQRDAGRGERGLPAELPMSNAYLNSVDTYYRLLPAFRRLLEQQRGDLPGFYKEVRALAKLKKEERHRRLNRYSEAWSPTPLETAGGPVIRRADSFEGAGWFEASPSTPPRTPSLSPAGGEDARRAGEGDSNRFMAPMRDSGILEALHMEGRESASTSRPL